MAKRPFCFAQYHTTPQKNQIIFHFFLLRYHTMRKKSKKSRNSIEEEDDAPTGVDGQGMWRSWTRVFAQPASAALDLLDNCLDAAAVSAANHSTTDNTTETPLPNSPTSSPLGLSSSSSFQGRVTLSEFPFHDSIVIHNNSPLPIRPLQDALTVYQTHKHNNNNNNNNSSTISTHNDTTTIGENGVGLKQGAACLSDCSLILTRNHSTIEIGILAQALQTPHRIYLPSTRCLIHQRRQHMTNWLQKHTAIRDCLNNAFHTVSTEQLVKEVLLELMERLFLEPFQDSVYSFLLVLTNIRPTRSSMMTTTVPSATSSTPASSSRRQQHLLLKQEEEEEDDANDKNDNNNDNDDDHNNNSPTPSSPSQAFLDHLAQLLPQYYIHLPKFPLSIGNTPIRFDYWAQRLVELTRFVVHIPLTLSLEEWWAAQQHDAPDNNNNNSDEDTTTTNTHAAAPNPASFPTYPLHIYCGFDALRVHDDKPLNRSSPCQLYVYSRTAGRRIVHERDARHILGLTIGGVDYTQGLTCLMVDTEGHLPLTPTKDGLAWSEQALHGHEHQRTVYAWAGACAHFFWHYHMKTFLPAGSRSSHATKHRKQVLKETIASFVLPNERVLRRSVARDQEDAPSLPTDNLQTADITTFPDMQWKVVTSAQGVASVRSAKSYQDVTIQRGKDTLFNLQEHYKHQRGASRAAAAARTSTPPRRQPRASAATPQPRSSLESVTNWDDNERDDFQSNVQQVGLRVLAYLRSQDSDEIFENPVIESFPEIKDSYLEVVSQPMDFWTIEQKLADYQDTSELKRDVQLIYSNCIAYNGEESHLTKIAKRMLHSLDDIFANILLGKRCRKRPAPKSWDSPVNNETNARSRPSTKSKAKSSPQKKQAPSLSSLQTKNKQLESKVKEQKKLIQKLQEQIQELQQQTGQSGDGCRICGVDNRPEEMLLCDQCNGEFHRHCLDPPLMVVPKGYWYCSDCGGV